MKIKCPSCGTAIPVTDSSNIECPDCGKKLRLPSKKSSPTASDADSSKTKPKKPARSIEENEEERPRRKKSRKSGGKSNLMYVILGGMAVLVLVITVALVFIFKGKTIPLVGEDNRPVDISKPPDFSLTTSELADDFKQSAANRKYARGIVELSGVVASYGREMSDDDTLTLNPTGYHLRGGEVKSFVTEKEPWARVCEGQQVKIRGRVATDSREPALRGCIITEAGPNQAKVVTAEEWIREYASDAESFKTSYDDKPLLVTGKIVRTDINPDQGIFEVYLQGDGTILLVCRFVTVSQKSRQQLKQLQVGQEIRVPGKFSRAEPDQARVGLAARELITGAK